MITLMPVLLYKNKFIDKMVLSLFYNITIIKVFWHATNIFRNNTKVYFVKYCINTEICWSKALPAKRWSLIFDENDKAIEFQMKFKSILKDIGAKKRLCITFDY